MFHSILPLWRAVEHLPNLQMQGSDVNGRWRDGSRTVSEQGEQQEEKEHTLGNDTSQDGTEKNKAQVRGKKVNGTARG